MKTNLSSEIAEQLRAFVCERFKVPPNDADFTDDTHLFDYGYVDSFGAVELTGFVESQFGAKITDSDLIVHPLNTINEISSFVASKLNNRS
jgi:D-alanine--poly(phosphoribitol) ligase subunit 2